MPPAKRRRVAGQAPSRPAKSARKRPSTDVVVPADVITIIVQHLGHHQRSLLLFSMVCRASRDAVLGNHQLWFEILRRTEVHHFRHFRYARLGPAVVRDIPMSPYPNFKPVEGNPRGSQLHTPVEWCRRTAEWPHKSTPDKTEPFTPPELEALAKFAIRRARIQTAHRCGLCGSRYHHTPVWGLGRRVCTACLKHNLVSSAALFHDYGFDFTQHMGQIAGRVFYFKLSDKRFIQFNLSHNPVDFRAENRANLVFFWRPHLDRVFDLQDFRAERRARADAISRVQALARALCVRLTLMQAGRPLANHATHAFFLKAPERPKSSHVGFYSESPCPEDQRRLVANWLPKGCKTRLLMEPELRAYRIVQRAFLAFRGRIMLPYVKNPAGVLERLRMHEALREEAVQKGSAPAGSGPLFLQWRDMAPLA